MKFEIILLGVIQGLTEWLPISSTGHLKLAEITLGLRPPLLFDITLHMGTLAVTILFFRSDVKEVLKALVRLDFYKSEGGLMLQRILVSTAFTATTGPLIMSLESLFRGVKMTGLLFLVSGLITCLSNKMKVNGKKHVNLKEAALIGTIQGFSILPGLSRSGLTISIALMLGVKREEAFKFSFLLSIPSIFGGLIITLIEYNELQKVELGVWEMLLGAFVSALLGYFSLKILRRTLKHFHNFAFYPLLLGSLLVLLGGS